MHRIKVFYGLLLAGIFLNNTIQAQSSKRIPSEKPRLIIEIVIDQMRYDYIFRYWDKYSDEGFKRLIGEGTFCKNANYNYFFTQSAPGHATLFTGANPAQHGIIADEWYIPSKKEKTNSTRDENYKTIGGSYEEGRYSPINLLSTTIGDELRLSNQFKSKVFSISLDASSSVLMGGHLANGSFWYDNESGNWISSSFYGDSLPQWVQSLNEKKYADLYINRIWEPLLPIKDYVESLSDSNKYETGINNRIVFPYNIGEINKLQNNVKKREILCYTPFGNSYTKDLAIECIVNEKLGNDEYPDLLAISFTSTSFVGNKFGVNSIENEDMFLRIDKDIAHLLNFVDDEIGKNNVLVILTSDHGMPPSPQYLADQQIPVGYFNSNGIISLLRSYLNIVYGKGDWIQYYGAQQIYLNRNLIEDSKIDLAEMQNKIMQFLLQSSGVANTMASSTIETTNFTSGVFQKMQNSYNQKRSGDIFINLEAGWMEKSGSASSSYTYDTHVPLIFYGWKIKRSTISKPIDMTSVAPTLSTFLNISFPNGCVGSPIVELAE